MKEPSPAHLETARRLLSREGGDGQSSQEQALAAARVYAELCLRLSPLIGADGVHALLARSLKLTKAAFPCLEGIAATAGRADGLADRLRECLLGQGPLAVTETAAALFGTFFTLLTTFIGDRLTAQVLEGAWPETAEPAPPERKT